MLPDGEAKRSFASRGAAATECTERIGFEKLTSTGKQTSPARKSGVEQGHRSMPDFEQSKRSAAEQAVVLPLNVEQFNHLAFAVLCQVGSLQDGHEANNPEVREAIACLDDLLGQLEALRGGRSS